MTKWKKYTRDIWNTTKYYYEKAQKSYSGKVTNNIYAHPILVNPGVANEVFDLSKDYSNKISNLAQVCMKTLQHSHSLRHNTNKYVTQWQLHQKSYPAEQDNLNLRIEEVLQEILPNVEKIYNSKVSIIYPILFHTFSQPEPEPDNGSTWQWHYDSYAEECYKVIIYLTDVTEKNAPFVYLVDKDNKPVVTQTRAKWVGPDDNKSREELYGPNPNPWDSTRIPSQWVEEKKASHGYKEVAVTGKKGSFIFFTPNVIHKATVAKEGYRQVISFTLKPSFINNKEYWKSAPAHKECGLHDWYKYEPIDEDGWIED
tara:strand:+ start:129 stop:1067 length:939 start_codon:yes stop_codon:yes gene_type:complete